MTQPATTRTDGWNLTHSYAELPDRLFVRQAPVPVREPRLALFNATLAEELGLDHDALDSPEGAAIFAGNELPPGSNPIAQAYAGHQFGHFTMLGDGRAVLLGEQLRGDGARFDIQLKGSGQTPFSRRGDGRAALGPMLREYLISEAMQALGIPTTRSLAVVTTGEPVYRETMLQGAILTRVAASHIRVGTFQYAAALEDRDVLTALTHYTLDRHYPEANPTQTPARTLFEQALERQAHLIAQWLLVGFIHGVMNTDNMALSGETIDYGPCAFMDQYDPGTVFSSIDSGGRYAYGNQPGIAQWNLAKLAEALLPIWGENLEESVEEAREVLGRFPARFEEAWLNGMRIKLGLARKEEGDLQLAKDLLEWMQGAQLDYTTTFRQLTHSLKKDHPAFEDPAFGKWEARWKQRLQGEEDAAQRMSATNPAYIPRNHRVEEALAAVVEREDWAPFHRLMERLRDPFADESLAPELTQPAPDGGRGYRTFCGT